MIIKNEKGFDDDGGKCADVMMFQINDKKVVERLDHLFGTA